MPVPIVNGLIRCDGLADRGAGVETNTLPGFPNCGILFFSLARMFMLSILPSVSTAGPGKDAALMPSVDPEVLEISNSSLSPARLARVVKPAVSAIANRYE